MADERAPRQDTALTMVWLGLLLLAPGLAFGEVFSMDTSSANRERLQARVEVVLALSDEQTAAMVPVSGGGVYFTSCPNCAYGAEEAGCFNETWDPRQPGRLLCKGCGEVYPDNPKYPDERSIEVEAPAGAKHRLHYYERATDGYRFWFRAHAEYWAREYLENAARDLGDLYRLTHEERYARRAAVILNRFAEVVPGYVYKFDYPFKQKLFVPYTQNRVPGVPGDYRTSRWTWWAYMDIPVDLVRAYEGIKDWPGWPSFAGGQARQRIEGDLIVPLVEFVMGFADDGSNMSMGMWRGAILAGRVLGRPEWVHESVRRFERVLAKKFLYDGHWLETSDSYATQTQGGLQVVMEAGQGYSDPPWYTDPVDGRRFEQLDLRRVAPDYEVAERVIGAARLPDNRLLPVNDTWAVHGKTDYWTRGSSTPRERTESVLLPATGIAVLGGGEGADQMHCWLNYTMGHHHKHSDALSLGLWANGYELLSDIGYTWTNYRLHWPTVTMSHNTVVVNGIESGLDRLHQGHRLLAYGSDGALFHLAAVQSDTAYPKVTSRYRRTVAVIGADSREAYVVDVFEVHGGTQHDWLLHGCRDVDSVALTPGLELRPYAGTLMNPGIAFRLPQSFQDPNPPGFGFGFIGDVRQAPTDGMITLDFRVLDQPRLGMRTLVAGMAGTELFAGRAPDIRRAREMNADLDKTQAPVFCLRRRGQDLQSVFVATHEPVRGEPGVRALSATQASEALLISVDRGQQGTDYIAMALAASATARFDTPHGTLQFAGRYAWLRLDAAGLVRTARLYDSSRLQFGAVSLEERAGWTGTVQSWDVRGQRDGSRGSLVVDQNLAGTDLGPLLLTFADGTVWPFNVVGLEPLGGGTRVHVRERPAFTVAAGKTTITSFPQRDIEGTALRFSLPRLVAWNRPD
jgi:hypothetical protein